MISLVIDSSVALSWFFQDEASDYSDSVLRRLRSTEAIVPTIWPLEVINVLQFATSKGRISPDDADSHISDLLKLRIYVDQTTNWPPGEMLRALTRDGGLTSYDASYICLAHRYRVPIATLDERMRRGAEQAEVGLWES